MIIKNSLLAGILICMFVSCKKSAHFINTNLPSGTYYYPMIINTLTDTSDNAALNGHYYNAGDTVSFEMDFLSQDSVSNIILTATAAGKTDTVSNIPFTADLYSPLKNADTVFFQYFIPATAKKGAIILQPTVYTIYNIYTSGKDTINIR